MKAVVTGGAFPQVAKGAYPQLEPEWVDEVLLAGAAGEMCLHLNEPVSRAELRRMVAERHRALADAGLRPGGSVALCLAPSLAFITNLLASWQIGAQASLLDHRLTPYEVDVALQRLLPQVVVTAEHSTGRPLQGFAEITERVRTYPGRPAATTHAVIQLSSGSTDPSKIIARDAANLVDEVKRYTMIDGVPGSGELVFDVLLLLMPDADPARDRDGEVRAALGEVAAAVPPRIVTIRDDEIVVGPTGKVRKFIMRQRLLASTGAS